MKINHAFLAGAIASAVVSLGATTLAADITTIESQITGSLVTLDSAPVVSAILSQPGTFGGHAYTGWSFLVQDSTGSLDIFATAASLTTLGYTPTVGDTLNLAGTYSPFHQIPEIATLTAISKVGTGVPGAPVVATIPDLNVATLPFSLAGQLIKLENVTISGGPATFPDYTGGNISYTVTDSANNSMILYDWVTSYSTASSMGGTSVPTGPVDIIGFDSVFTSGTTSTAEFTPISVTAVPEPSTFALIGLGLASLLIKRRRVA